jgi:hypothetical protein
MPLLYCNSDADQCSRSAKVTFAGEHRTMSRTRAAAALSVIGGPGSDFTGRAVC